MQKVNNRYIRLKDFKVYLECPRRACITVQAETRLDAENKVDDMIEEGNDFNKYLTDPFGEWGVSMVEEMI